VTTVGYGDVIPATTEGKVMAGFLMLGGLSLIAVVTAAITSGFVSRVQAQSQQASNDPLMLKLDQLAAQLHEVKAELAQLRSGGGSDGSS
jgi:voltage-gated potassium channel